MAVPRSGRTSESRWRDRFERLDSDWLQVHGQTCRNGQILSLMSTDKPTQEPQLRKSPSKGPPITCLQNGQVLAWSCNLWAHYSQKVGTGARLQGPGTLLLAPAVCSSGWDTHLVLCHLGSLICIKLRLKQTRSRELPVKRPIITERKLCFRLSQGVFANKFQLLSVTAVAGKGEKTVSA